MAAAFWPILVVLASTAAAAASPPVQRPHGSGDGAFEVRYLPGYDGNLPSWHRAGYVTVDRESGRRLYFYLAGSESDAPQDDPLIVWLTGGPGCSSLDAFTYENGPFIFTINDDSDRSGRDPSADDVRLRRNPYAWTSVAHVLYVDSPAGTGMSYSTDPEGGGKEYRTDDSQTVEDLLTLLLGVLDDAPDMRHRDVYIAGESYGGVYVPLLSQRILRHNIEAQALERGRQPQRNPWPELGPGREQAWELEQQQPASRRLLSGGASQGPATAAAAGAGPMGSVARRGGRRRVRLTGYLVGNGVTDDEVDGNALVPYAWDAGLIDKDTRDSVTAACRGNFWNATHGGACWDALGALDHAIGDINPYDVLSPCFFPRRGAGPAGGGLAAGRARAAWPLAARFPLGGPVGNWWAGAAAGPSGGGRGVAPAAAALGHTIACADRRAALAYYNDPRVRCAIHAAPASEAGRWEPCSDVLHYTHTAPSMVPVHRALVAAGLRGLVFSGLQDSVVPFTGTRRWVASLGLPTEAAWRPWKVGGQVGGHAVRYRAEGEGPLTYATVLGAGHMVPQTRPASALRLLRLWLRSEL